MTVTIGHRTFTFVRPTIGFIRKIAPKNYETMFSAEAFNATVEDDKALAEMQSKWRDFCNDVFVKDLRWRVFGLPSCLEYDNLTVGGVLEVARGFFNLLQAIRTADGTLKNDSPVSEASTSESTASPETTKSTS